MENRVSLQVSGEIICFSVSFIHCWKSDYKNKTWKCFLTPKVAEAFPSDGQRPLCACSTFKVLLVGAIHFGEEGLSHFVELWRWMFPLTFLNSAEFQSPVSHQIQNQLGLNEVSHSPLLKLMCEINTGSVHGSVVDDGTETRLTESGHRDDRCEGRCRCQGTQHRSVLPCSFSSSLSCNNSSAWEHKCKQKYLSLCNYPHCILFPVYSFHIVITAL